MVDILRDPTTGDLDSTNHLVTLTEDPAILAQQRIQLSLEMNLGEWAFNIQRGIPYITEGDNEQILGKQSPQWVVAKISSIVLEDPLVSEITNTFYNFDRANAILVVAIEALLFNGETVTITQEV